MRNMGRILHKVIYNDTIKKRKLSKMKVQKVYRVIESATGFVLKSDVEKLVLNRSKKHHVPSDYYLKQVEPTDLYISGMFYDKKTNQYQGKDISNRTVLVNFTSTSAIVTYLS